MTGVNRVTVFILAGGRSTRMGSDKALLPWRGTTLLEHALATGRQIAEAVKVIGPRARYAKFHPQVVEDEFANSGPLAGIHAALGATDSDCNVVLSVDTPLVGAAFLQYLLKRAEAKPEALATVPHADGGVQATCAVYRREFRSIAEDQLRRGHYKIGDALKLARVEYVKDEEMRVAGFDPTIFANLNTPEEFAKAGER
jgi:molybdopterin-guanine dinucleotide biosynthesis protein A